MAHLLIIDLPGGNDTDLIDAALAAGHGYSFLSSHLAHDEGQPVVAERLVQAHELIELPGFEMVAVEQAVLDLHRRRPIDAVLCLIDLHLAAAATLEERLGVVHISRATATLLRDRFSVRQCLDAHGLAQPDYALATSNREVVEAVQRLGLPVLIKPADGYGSHNIVVVRDEFDLDPLIGLLDALLPSRADYGLGVLANDRLLVERFMHGEFVGCDTLSLGGRHVLLGLNTKRMFEAPSFAIAGGCFMPNQGQFAELERYVIELHLGRWPKQLVPDRDLARPDELDAPQVAVPRWIVADRPGRLDRVELPGVISQTGNGSARIGCVELLKRSGDSVRPPLENADRIGYVMACGPTRADAEALAEAYVAAARVVMADN